MRGVGSVLRSLPLRLRTLLERGRFESELDEELRSHVERQVEANVRAGMSPAQARRAALLSFGSLDAVKEECRESRGVHFFDTLGQDLRYALRSLKRNRGFTAAVVLTLGLGIGANTAIFSVVNGILLRPLPYGEGARIVSLRHDLKETNAAGIGFSPVEIEDLRRLSTSLDALSEYHSMNFTLLGGAEPLRVRTGVVSSNFFDMLGVGPLFGRAFRPDDEVHGAEPVLLLSHAWWLQAFGGDPAVVGRAFRMNDRPHLVIGVLPPLPAYPDENDVYMPSTACPFRARAAATGGRQARMLSAIGRLQRGVAPEAAHAELSSVMSALAGELGDAYLTPGTPSVAVEPTRELMVRTARPTFLILLATVAFVLMIACANVANLALARLLDRGREIALRAALGAGRRRLLRQLLTESLVLALAGGVVGLLFAVATQGAVVRFASRFTPRASDVGLDGTVLAFTLAISLIAGLLFGTLPGLPSAEQLARSASSDDGRLTGGPGRRRMRAGLVVAQVALSFTLVIGAALLLRSFAKLQAVHPGFEVENVLTVRLDLNFRAFLDAEGRTDVPRLATLHESLHERIAALPGVVAVSNAWTFPLNARFDNDGTVQLEGRPPGGPPVRAELIGTTPDYFRALGVPLKQGRFLTAADRGTESDAILVNERFAARELPEGALGRRLSYDGGKTWRTIVGVVGDMRQAGLAEEPKPSGYLPFSQFPGVSSSLIVRASLPPATLVAAVRKAVHDLDPDAAVSAPRTLAEIRHDSIASPRLTAQLLGLFAGLALAIAATGLSGVLAYSVSQRTREIGVRVALGAAPGDVLRLVMREGLSSLGLGLALGLVAALGLSRLVARLLFGVEPTDPLCFAGSLAVLVVAGTIACLVPARRAVAVEPVQALRTS
ncbi:MAG TPA: ABC transporter permease [Vicinamibacteria bacterium]|nr:ABC transporter permease [Vicinamibacteria bacterium]